MLALTWVLCHSHACPTDANRASEATAAIPARSFRIETSIWKMSGVRRRSDDASPSLASRKPAMINNR